LLEKTARKIEYTPRTRTLLILLLAGDLIFVILHLLHKFSTLLPSSLFSLTRDLGYAEYYQYVKEFCIILLLLALAVRLRKLLYVSYAGLFVYFLLDDFFQIHETAGKTLANFVLLQSNFGLRAQDFGELAVYAFMGLIFAILIGLAHYLSDAHTRKFSRQLFILILLLAVFGVVFDMLEISTNHPVINPLFNLIDDGGELLVMSLIIAFVFHFLSTRPKPGSPSQPA